MINTAKGKYEMVRLYDCDTSMINRSACPLLYSFFGGPLCKQMTPSRTYFQFLGSSGIQLGDLMDYKSAEQFNCLFLLPDARLGILFRDCGICICNSYGHEDIRIPPQENSTVLCSSLSYFGLSFITSTGKLFFFDFSSLNIAYDMDVAKLPPISMISLHDYDSHEFFLVCSDNIVYSKTAATTSSITTNLGSQPLSICVAHKGPTFAAIFSNRVLFISATRSPVLFPQNLVPDKSSLFSWVDDCLFLMTSPTSVKFISESPEIIEKPMSAITALIPDFSCVRILSSDGCFIVRRLPQPLLQLKSDACKASELADSYSLFSEKSIDSYKSLNSIRGMVESAVIDLISASLSSVRPQYQQLLLQIASFGRFSIQSSQSSQFSDAIKAMRIRNTLNCPEFGFSVTPDMDDRVRPFVIERCLNLRQFSLALTLCDFFNESRSTVVERWAIDSLHKSGESAISTVLSALSKHTDINYLLISQAAFDSRISFESVSAIASRIESQKERVQFFYPKNQNVAKEIALMSNDGASLLTYLALTPRSELRNLVRNEATLSLHLLLAKKWRMAEDLQKSREDKKIRIPQNLKELCSSKRGTALSLSLLHCSESFGCANEDLKFSAELCEKDSPFISILNKQMVANDISNGSGCSPRLILSKAILSGNESEVEQAIKKFGFSARVVNLIRMRTYIKNSKFEELKTMTRSPIAGIGWDRFAIDCAEAGNKNEAIRFINLITDLRQKADICQKYSYWKEAAQFWEAAGETEKAERASKNVKPIGKIEREN